MPNRFISLVTAGCLAAIAAGCTTPERLSLWRPLPNLENTELSLKIHPGSERGVYTLSGTAALPNGTTMTVLAVRQLQLQQAPLVESQPKSTYSILTYETVTVERDRWQTELSLWQVAPDGEFKEAWQIQAPELELAVTPAAEVLFLATLAPVDDLEAIERELAQNNQRFAREVVQTTAEGNRYLQTGKVLEVALPTGKTAPVALREEDLNGGWGNRFLDLPDLPNERLLEFPENRQTDAPVMPEEFLY